MHVQVRGLAAGRFFSSHEPTPCARVSRFYLSIRPLSLYTSPGVLACAPANVATCPLARFHPHTSDRAMGGLFYIKQYGNIEDGGRKMSNKDTRALPCYYAITYHPFLHPPPLSTPSWPRVALVASARSRPPYVRVFLEPRRLRTAKRGIQSKCVLWGEQRLYHIAD